MLTVEEAREMTKKGRKEQIKKQYESIIGIIKDMAMSGYYSYTFTGAIYPENYDKLIELGYKVKYKSRLMHTYSYTIISWEE